jgi:hypothetical protein
MGLVTHELAGVPEEDVDAMAAYVVGLMGPPTEARKARAEALQRDPLALDSRAPRNEGSGHL